MAGPQAAPGFTVEVFIKQNEVTPMRVAGVLVDLAVTWAFATFVRQKNTGKPERKFVRHFLERQHVSGADGTFHLERFAIEQVITLERFDDEKVDRKPNRPAPVRVATEKITRSFARNVINAVFVVADTENIRLFVMDTR